MNQKRGLSPVIATMLLIVIVIVIGLVIFLWFRGITEEAITKFNGKNVKIVCDEVKMQASYNINEGIISISNIGNVPIFKVKVRIYTGADYMTITLNDNWPGTGLNQGATYSGTEISYPFDKLLVIPVLLGESDKGDVAYTCEERHAEEIIV